MSANAEARRKAAPSPGNAAPSPRTTELPMAFTRWEFWRGAYAAYAAYLVWLLLSPLLWGVSAGGIGFVVVMAMYSLVIGGAVAFVAMLAASPLAWLLGRSLRRVRPISAHLAAFAALGALVGWVALEAWAWGSSGGHAPLDQALLPYGVPAAVAVPLGWWFTARRALRADRGLTPARPPRHDADAEFEDAS